MSWVKLYRRLTEWEWYHDSQMVHLFLHLVLKANHKDKKWKGHLVKRGQLITGRKQLCKETGISEQSIRTCVTRLKSTNEITSISTSKFSLVTICNYDDYQELKGKINQHINQRSNQQLTSNQPATNHKQEVKEVKEEKITAFNNNAVDPFYLTKKKKKLSGEKLEWFNNFWKAFNLKKGKAESADAWLEITNLNKTLAATIYKAAQQEASARESLTNGSTPKWAQGWLSGRRWEDEALSGNKGNEIAINEAEETRRKLEAYG